jgi:hypothetical protein
MSILIGREISIVPKQKPRHRWRGFVFRLGLGRSVYAGILASSSHGSRST